MLSKGVLFTLISCICLWLILGNSMQQTAIAAGLLWLALGAVNNMNTVE